MNIQQQRKHTYQRGSQNKWGFPITTKLMHSSMRTFSLCDWENYVFSSHMVKKGIESEVRVKHETLLSWYGSSAVNFKLFCLFIYALFSKQYYVTILPWKKCFSSDGTLTTGASVTPTVPERLVFNYVAWVEWERSPARSAECFCHTPPTMSCHAEVTANCSCL